MYFWNKRGNLIQVDRKDKIKELLESGFIRATEDEVDRYGVGGYHPAYDHGDGQIPTVKPAVIVAPTPSTDGEYLETIEV